MRIVVETPHLTSGHIACEQYVSCSHEACACRLHSGLQGGVKISFMRTVVEAPYLTFGLIACT